MSTLSAGYQGWRDCTLIRLPTSILDVLLVLIVAVFPPLVRVCLPGQSPTLLRVVVPSPVPFRAKLHGTIYLLITVFTEQITLAVSLF